MAPAKLDRNIKIRITKHFRDIDFSLSKLRKLIRTICRRFEKNKPAHPDKSSNKYEISVVVVDNAEFKKINHQFLRRKSLSDCLSFDLSDDNESGSPKNFELIINGQMAVRQANLRGHSAEAELALYITHGLLHNFNFDDLEPVKAEIMHAKEDEILQELGYGFVYNTSIEPENNRNR
ncbi:MAG: rRNA maturation RNase YbeY [Sedimentisphaerales bacterium]|nr:rRNA maturation RNase YbeY [Sedimentisphaerales bacterium]